MPQTFKDGFERKKNVQKDCFLPNDKERFTLACPDAHRRNMHRKEERLTFFPENTLRTPGLCVF